jgi:choline transport protein
MVPTVRISVPDHPFPNSLFVAVGQTLLMMSLAEYCSIWPTAGGQQYYTQALATGATRPFLSYVVGWAVIVGEISTGSSCALNSAQIIASFVQVTHPSFTWHVSTYLPDSNLQRSFLD